MLHIPSKHNIIHLLIYVVYIIFFLLTLQEIFDSLHACGRCSKENLVSPPVALACTQDKNQVNFFRPEIVLSWYSLNLYKIQG